MKQYLDIAREILENGHRKNDPQGVGNRALCSPGPIRIDLEKDGFPLLTTKDMTKQWKPLVCELLWFLSGSTNVADLHKHGVHFWDIWATPEICFSLDLPSGELGPIYGKQWRSFGRNGIDQISRLVNNLKKNPDTRRNEVTSWNPEDIDKVFVAPCHDNFKVFHAEGMLWLRQDQRSCDLPIGAPFNIAQYALLLMMLAQVAGLKAKGLIYAPFDCHIYENQIDAMKLQISREPKTPPRVKLNPNVKDIFNFRPDDFILENYNPHPGIKFPVAL